MDARLKDVSNAAIRKLLANRVLSRPVLAINAGSAATVKTTSAIEFTVDGIIYNKAALSAQSIAVTHNFQRQAQAGGYVQPVSKTVYYTLGLNSAGTLSVVQGTYAGQVLSADPTVGVGMSVAGATLVGDGSIPDTPDGYTPFGLIKVVTDATHTFTAGTTVLDSAGITATYSDLNGAIPTTAP